MTLVLAILSIGCSIPGGASVEPLLGEYGVIEVDGEPIPARLPPEGDCDRVLTLAKLSMRPGKTFSLDLGSHRTCPDHSEAIHQRITGHYAAADGELVLTTTDGNRLHGVLREGEIGLAVFGVPVKLRLGEAGEGDIMEFLEREIAARIEQQARVLDGVYGRPKPYDCASDPHLAAVAPIARTDTVGLGTRIERQFPAWRLTTEREIACRFPASGHVIPHHLWAKEWGSGHAWWIWSGDFNGDGADDRLILLTSKVDSDDDLLAVLFANGSAAEVGRLGARYVRVGPMRGTIVEPISEEGMPFQLHTDAISIHDWDLIQVHYWTEDGFATAVVQP